LCVPLCLVQALSVDEKTKKITFSEDKCIACELCVKICPNRAMEVHF
jgi:Fe-S-cluster-containing hydrogenase component 2